MESNTEKKPWTKTDTKNEANLLPLRLKKSDNYMGSNTWKEAMNQFTNPIKNKAKRLRSIVILENSTVW